MLKVTNLIPVVNYWIEANLTQNTHNCTNFAQNAIAHTRMQLEGGLAVGRLDFTLRGSLTYTQDAVQILSL